MHVIIGTEQNGGQPGHQGHTLERYPDPAVVQNHVCDYCRECGSSLSTISSTMEGTRQVIDLPVIVPYNNRTSDLLQKMDLRTCQQSRLSGGCSFQNILRSPYTSIYILH